MPLDASALLDGTYCLEHFSKNVTVALLLDDAKEKTCESPDLRCTTLTQRQELVLNLYSADCDSQLGKLLDGVILVKNLATVFINLPLVLSKHNRAVHAADFEWNPAPGGLALGNLHGDYQRRHRPATGEAVRNVYRE